MKKSEREHAFVFTDNSVCVSKGTDFLTVGEREGRLILVAYAPDSLGERYRKDAFDALWNLAVEKLGWVKDRRCKTGYRKLEEPK